MANTTKKYADLIRGKRFKSRAAESNADYLRAAEAFHPYLELHKTADEEGARWADGENVNLSLYGGSAGIAYYYLELYRATGKREYEALALQGADYLSRHWPELIVENNFLGPAGNVSLYVGITSVGEVLAQFYKYYPKEEYERALRGIAYRTIVLGADDGRILTWGPDKCVLMGGGAALFLYRAARILEDPVLLAAANRAAEGILADAIPDERGGLAWTSYLHPGQTRVPNFECGTAGIALVLAEAYDFSGDARYLAAAKEAAKYLKIISVPVGDGWLVPWHDNPNEEPLFYVSTCHGPAGTSRLFYKLWKLTGEETYLEDIQSLYRGIRALGVPEAQSPGYWNTVGLCCGTAGVLQFFINLSLIADDPEVRGAAVTAGNILLGTSEKQEAGIAWPLAFERVRPDVITTSIAYGTGSAGVAIPLIELYLFLEGRFDWDRLFEDPYPAKQA